MAPAAVKVALVPEHVFSGTGVILICGAGLIITASVCCGDVPQALLAFTEIVPPVVDGMQLIVFVLLVPDHPEGIFQLYEVAPDEMLDV